MTVVLRHEYEGALGQTEAPDDSAFDHQVDAFQTNAEVVNDEAMFGSQSLFLGDADGSRLDIVNDGNYGIGTDDFTVETYIFPLTDIESAGEIWRIVCHWSATGNQRGWNWVLFNNGGNRTIRFVSSATGVGATITDRVFGTGVFTTGSWHHLAVSRESGTLRMFIDGTQIGTDASHSNTIFEPSVVFALGSGDISVSAEQGSGYLDRFIFTLGEAKYTEDFDPFGITGDLAATEAADTAAMSATVETSGDLAATEGADTAAISATVSTAGDLAATEAADTLAASASVITAGDLAATEGADTFAGSITVSGVSVVTGDLAVTEPQDVASFISLPPAALFATSRRPDRTVVSARLDRTITTRRPDRTY